MHRFLAAFKTDVIVQYRTKLYFIGIAVGVLVAIAVALLALPQHLKVVIPALMLLVIGGSTLLYVAAMIIFEKDNGTLNALVTSPLRSSEYLVSKTLSLSMLASLEAIIMIGGAMAIMAISHTVPVPNVVILLTGILLTGVVYTLFGIILIVRFPSITDFLFPMAGITTLLQLPTLYFFNAVSTPIFLLIPTSAPIMLIKGAHTPLAMWEWAYAIGYTLVLLIVLGIWAHRSFRHYMINQLG